MQHRNDIDGLRAVAILPILLFHAGLTQMSGGFIGVDIFFVISGFLITSIITREMNAGTFSILTFYKRRVVRIFPALFVTLTLVLLAGCLFMLPSEVAPLGKSAAAAAGFVSNIYFWKTADYFAGSADLKPLLHTWSLGVEEQFYIFYPLMVLLVTRFLKRWLALAIGLTTLGSFVFSLGLAVVGPNAAFYLLPSRAWELGLGGLIAVGAFPVLPWAWLRTAAPAVGAVLIAAGLAFIRADSLFPAPWALLPCLGAALIIAYGQGSLVGRALSIQPLRWIGAISYSLYLLHWPIIAFYRLLTGISLSPVESACLVAASVAAAAVSYYLVEQPVLRRFRTGPAGKILGVGTVALAAGLAASAVVTVNADNWRSYTPEARRIMSYARYVGTGEHTYQYRPDKCFIESTSRHGFDRAFCLKRDPGKTNIVVLGDSHAAQYWRAIALRFPDKNVMQATASGCRPTLHTQGEKRCTDLVNYVLGDFLAKGGADAVVLSGRWKETDVSNLVETVRFLKSKRIPVTVIGPTVEYDGEFPEILARAMLQDGGGSVTNLRLTQPKAMDEKLAALMKAEGVPYVSEQNIECPADRCMTFAPGQVPFHFDYGHMPLSAARYVISKANI
ncbi:MAG: acyltransferase [Caulobacter sp.]|nr:acyltransferase [Caulobacter sp.]